MSAGVDIPAWVPSSSQLPNSIIQDLELGLRAHNALLQDQTLAGQTLGVSVLGRIATLWGTAPSASAARHAEVCLRQVPGLGSVRNELYVESRGEPQGKRFVLPSATARTPLAQPLEPEKGDCRLFGQLVHRPTEQGQTPRQRLSWRPVERKPPQTAPPGFPDQAVMPSLSLSPRPTATDSDRTSVSSSSIKPELAASLATAVESLRLADERFRGVRVEVRDDTVYLRGAVYRAEHLDELAQSVSRLPGVKRVLFEDVRTELPR